MKVQRSLACLTLALTALSLPRLGHGAPDDPSDLTNKKCGQEILAAAFSKVVSTSSVQALQFDTFTLRDVLPGEGPDGGYDILIDDVGDIPASISKSTTTKVVTVRVADKATYRVTEIGRAHV